MWVPSTCCSSRFSTSNIQKVHSVSHLIDSPHRQPINPKKSPSNHRQDVRRQYPVRCHHLPSAHRPILLTIPIGPSSRSLATSARELLSLSITLLSGERNSDCCFMIGSMRSPSWYVVGNWPLGRKLRGCGRLVWLTVCVQENWEMSNGPLSLLQTAVRSHSQVLISIRSNRKL